MAEVPKSVLLVEDHSSFREALAMVLEREPDLRIITQAGSLAEARESLEGIDLAIVDLGLPDGDGIDLIGELLSASPRTATLVLSASVDTVQFARAVEAGAAGVLHKSTGIKEIAQAARGLLAGETLLSPNETIDMLRLVTRKREQDREAQLAIDKLTSREREVLRALAEGLDGQEIASRLHIAVETERTHMVNIYKKIGVHSRLQAVVFAVRHGVVDLGES